MKNSTKDRPRAVSLGKTYDSVAALMQGEETPKVIREKVSHLLSESRIATQMAVLRQRAGITQQKMAESLGLSQSAISKLESGKDSEITLNHINEYSRITRERIHLMFGTPYGHMEAVKLHIDGLKTRLEKLAEIANQDLERQNEIKESMTNAFYNLSNIIILCSGKLPVSENDCIEEIRMEIIGKPDSKSKKLTEPNKEKVTV